MYLNKVMLIGNLTRDPDLKALQTGTKVASISLATNRVWKDAQGEKKESVEFHNVVAFGKQAETLAQYCKKGSSMYFEGRLQTRSWDAQDGSKKYRTEIVLESFQFGSKNGSGSNTTSEPKEKSFDEKVEDLDNIEYPDDEINIVDVPF